VAKAQSTYPSSPVEKIALFSQYFGCFILSFAWHLFSSRLLNAFKKSFFSVIKKYLEVILLYCGSLSPVNVIFPSIGSLLRQPSTELRKVVLQKFCVSFVYLF